MLSRAGWYAFLAFTWFLALILGGIGWWLIHSSNLSLAVRIVLDVVLMGFVVWIVMGPSSYGGHKRLVERFTKMGSGAKGSRSEHSRSSRSNTQ